MEMPEGNLTMAEYAQALLKRSEPEGKPQEETEAAEEEPVAEDDPLAIEEEVAQEEPDEESAPPAETSEDAGDVLADLNVDLDSLSEEQATELAKRLNASAVKRFGKLTAQKKALAEQNEALQQQVTETKQSAQAGQAPAFLRDNALSNATTAEELISEVENLNSLMEWAEENLENEVQYDDEGNEYAARDGDKVYTKADLRRIRNNARKIIRKDAPARQKWIEERMQSDKDAVQTFDFLGDPESDEYGLFMQAKSSPLYKPLVDYLPNSNFALALMVKGQQQVLKEREEASKPKKAVKPKAPAVTAEAAPAAREPKGKKASTRKALEAAKAKYETTGSSADYESYLRLRQKAA